MMRCLHCRGRGVYSDGGRLVCLMCAYVAADPEPTMAEKILSNMSPEEFAGQRGRRALIDIEAVKARVLAAVRAEAAR